VSACARGRDRPAGAVLIGLPKPEPGSHEGLLAACMALLLCLFAVAIAGVVPEEQVSVDVAISALPGEARATSEDGNGVLLPASGDDSRSAALLRFALPEPDGRGSRWVVRIERDPVDALWLQRGTWRSDTLDFFAPRDDEGILPGGYLFPLPADWTGPIELQLHARGNVRSALRPKVMREAEAMRLEQYGVATSAMVYASLFTIGLLALALFSAARDRLFLALFAYIVVTLLTLGAANGHLYQLPGLRLFAFWRGPGLYALGMLLAASWLQMLLQYAGAEAVPRPGRRVVDIACLALVVFAAACLLNITALSDAFLRFGATAWALALVLGLAILFDAGRRRVAMAWPLAVLTLLTLVGVVMMDLSMRGQLLDSVLVRYGYQLGIVVSVAILSVGLVSRIGEYRHQRDRELLARTDTERRMQREAARSNLAATLQTSLRALPVADIEWSAFRELLDRLGPLLPMERGAMVAQGYHGHDTLVVEPVPATDAVKDSIARRTLALKRLAANGIPQQQPVASEATQSVVAIEAVVPLPIRAPAWGVLLLQRAGTDGFTTEELSLAGDFARLALLHVDQAVAAVNLRRSAELDALTGSLNRRTIDQWLGRAFSEAARDQQPVSVLFLDLDHFKSINDRHGHACGDFCLRNVASALRGALQEGDLFGRYGGEEFIAILPGRAGAAARTIAEQLRAAVENLPLEWNGQALRLTVSVGVATRREHEQTPDEALARADKALYAAKRAGRNCVQVAPAVFS